uniref:Uncharacterized protein n=1 Tax=Eptatretus burgeri TaxID=7764 RepID=A0A8C4QXJ8_EPTBU
MVMKTLKVLFLLSIIVGALIQCSNGQHWSRKWQPGGKRSILLSWPSKAVRYYLSPTLHRVWSQWMEWMDILSREHRTYLLHH